MTQTALRELLDNKQYKTIHTELSDQNPVDLAELLSELDEQTLPFVFRMIEKEKAAEIFSYMDNDMRQVLIHTFTRQEIEEILDSMYLDDAADFLGDMPANLVTKLLENVDKETRTAINRLLQYPEDSAGSIMTVEFVELQQAMDVNSALAKIRRVGLNSETVYTCYVVEGRKLLGTVSAKDLLINSGDTPLTELMTDNFISVKTTDDKEYVANLFRKYGLIAIPVVDSEGCIVGIVTFDDAIEVLTDETTEDIHKMAAIAATDEEYLKMSVFKHAKSRIIWLLILMFSATITGSIIASYQDAFALIPLLVSFIPMLMDTGGNCGSQSSTLIIRGFAVEELTFADTPAIIWKEFRVSLVVGAALALANTIRVILVYHDIQLAIVIGFSLAGTVVAAKLVGCMLPILAKKLHLDPAIMAAPIITTIVDACSIIVYFKIATLVFKL